MVAWLFQLFRHDLAPVVRGFPHADGRYNHRLLDAYPSADRLGYLAWRDHPNTGRPAPVGFALCERGPTTWSLAAFWVTPVVRREGAGTRLALESIARHPGRWTVAFQHDNVVAGPFWRRCADVAFGPSGWTEERRPIKDRPDVPADHVIVGETPRR